MAATQSIDRVALRSSVGVHVDGAIVFEAGSARRTPINVIQGSWQSAVDEPKWTAICLDLEASAPASLWF